MVETSSECESECEKPATSCIAVRPPKCRRALVYSDSGDDGGNDGGDDDVDDDGTHNDDHHNTAANTLQSPKYVTKHVFKAVGCQTTYYNEEKVMVDSASQTDAVIVLGVETGNPLPPTSDAAKDQVSQVRLAASLSSPELPAVNPRTTGVNLPPTAHVTPTPAYIHLQPGVVEVPTHHQRSAFNFVRPNRYITPLFTPPSRSTPRSMPHIYRPVALRPAYTQSTPLPTQSAADGDDDDDDDDDDALLTAYDNYLTGDENQTFDEALHTLHVPVSDSPVECEGVVEEVTTTTAAPTHDTHSIQGPSHVHVCNVNETHMVKDGVVGVGKPVTQDHPNLRALLNKSRAEALSRRRALSLARSQAVYAALHSEDPRGEERSDIIRGAVHKESHQSRTVDRVSRVTGHPHTDLTTSNESTTVERVCRVTDQPYTTRTPVESQTARDSHTTPAGVGSGVDLTPQHPSEVLSTDREMMCSGRRILKYVDGVLCWVRVTEENDGPTPTAQTDKNVSIPVLFLQNNN